VAAVRGGNDWLDADASGPGEDVEAGHYFHEQQFAAA
jgi:hypothetical protein